MPDRSTLVLYPASAAVSSVVSSCFIYELVKSTKLAFSRNTLLSVPSGNPRSETLHALGIPVQRNPPMPPCLRNSSSKNPPCLWNSEKPSVGGYGYLLESPIVEVDKLNKIFQTCLSPDTQHCLGGEGGKNCDVKK